MLLGFFGFVLGCKLDIVVVEVDSPSTCILFHVVPAARIPDRSNDIYCHLDLDYAVSKSRGDLD